MQMSKCLAQREYHLMPIERSPEQHWEQLQRALGMPACGDDLRTTRPVVRRKSVDP